MSAPFTVRRSQRARRARVTMTREGDVVVVLPWRASASLAGELVERHARWIANHQARMAGEREVLAATPAIGEGRTLSLRGLPHDVVVEADAGLRRYSNVSLEAQSAPAIVIRQSTVDARSVGQLVEAWLRSEARRDLAERVAMRSADMDVRPNHVSVRDQRSRWGSASRRGTLSFSWRLVLCPPEILDYVVVHELAHLRWAGHGVRFWSMVRRHAPAADHYRRWLSRNEARLRHALD